MATTDITKSKATRSRRNPHKSDCVLLDTPLSVHMLNEKQKRLIERAWRVMESAVVYRIDALSNPSAVRRYLQMQFAGKEREEFRVLWLDAQNRLIASELLFSGTLTQTSIYPREILKSALSHNAAACIVAHNHPSGITEPSAADRHLTNNLKNSLSIIDVKLLDHFIVAGNTNPFSFAERGML